jgi:L-amino acid N-acyltransferase YncA
MMKSKSNIILADAKHHQGIATIYNEHISLGQATMDETLKQAQDIATWVNNFNPRERLFVLTQDELVIGWGIIKRYSDREGYRFTCETAVYLAQDQVGKGHGSLLKKHLLQVCKNLEYKHVVAKIFAVNEASIAYNEKLGYTQVGRQSQIGFKNGQWLDMVIMQYLIT